MRGSGVLLPCMTHTTPPSGSAFRARTAGRQDTHTHTHTHTHTYTHVLTNTHTHTLTITHIICVSPIGISGGQRGNGELWKTIQ